MFSNRIKELRKSVGITQKNLSEKTGIAQSVICYYENGKVEPTATALISLSNFFNVSVDYLLDREDDFGNIVIKNNASFAVSDAEKKHLTNLRRLKPQTQKYIFGLVENLALSV